MRDFVFHTPTEVVFGKEAEEKIAARITKYGGSRVLLHYGGQSAERSGLLPKIRQQLTEAGIPFTELGGVVPNPRLSLVREGIARCREEGIDFILAVGGGSVIDSSKAIAFGTPYEHDVWELFEGKGKVSACLPIGCVLTIPAAGSEMSDGCVITNEQGWLKRGYSTQLSRCRFAIMNPERTYTLPPYQTACGITDIMMHTMERYFSHEDDMNVTDAIAEAILRTVIDAAPVVMHDPTNYRYRAQIMWAGSLAHNDLTGCGTVGDWATHHLEHELSALFDVAHGAGLAAMWGSWARYVLPENPSRFARFAVNVLGVENDFTDPVATALKGIERMEAFYRSIGMPTSIPELIGRPATEEEILLLADKCCRQDTHTEGNFKVLYRKEMEDVYRLANR
ncbi:MAG: iron-containing alcohol dehydrogenase [Alistipes sp.]|nr:iron-containing alcohol dehydrogenase [Alistipes sp.]